MRKNRFIPLVLMIALWCVGCSQQADQPKPPTDQTRIDQKSSAAVSPESEKSSLADKSSPAVDSSSDQMTADDDWGSDFDEFDDEFAPAKEQRSDPLEGYNRFMTSVNDKLYIYVLDPVARGYRWLLPEIVRDSIDRFFTNLLYPIRAVNNLLQFKFKNTGEETIRFITNSTIGIFGLFDPAKAWFGLEAHDEDFGQTLGFYGVGAGPHIVLPILGPSNLRDALSDYGDYVYLDPKARLDSTEVQIGLRVWEEVNWTSLHIGEYQSFKKDAVDWYLFTRDAYEQKRQKEIEE